MSHEIGEKDRGSKIDGDLRERERVIENDLNTRTQGFKVNLGMS